MWRPSNFTGLLAQAWPVWIGLGLPLLGWYALPFMFSGSRPIQYFGVALETAGVMLMAYELIEVRKYFDSPGILSIVRLWFKKLRDGFPSRKIFRGEEQAAGADADPPEESASQGTRLSIPDQIYAIRGILASIQNRLDVMQRLDTLEGRVIEERRQATYEVQMLASQLQTLTQGNIGREFVAVSLIVFGIVMANLPEDLYRLWLAI